MEPEIQSSYFYFWAQIPSSTLYEPHGKNSIVPFKYTDLCCTASLKDKYLKTF